MAQVKTAQVTERQLVAYARFIKEHGVNCHVTVDGRLRVDDVYSDGSSQWIVIEPTMAAIKDFLNY